MPASFLCEGKYGEEYQKRTFLWTNVQELIDEMAHAERHLAKLYPDGHRSLCGGRFCCRNGWPGRESSTHLTICADIRTSEATPFPTEFCVLLAQKLEAECAYRRWQHASR